MTWSVSVDARDPWRAFTAMSALLLIAGVAMAVFGLPPVDLHGPWHRAGIMMPTCGGTRAARLFMQGDLAGAWRYNPLGIVAVVGATGFLFRAVGRVVTGAWWTPQLALSRRGYVSSWLLLAVAVAALWARQQSIAPLLMLH